jgi:AraC-like DNA-binding protein
MPWSTVQTFSDPDDYAARLTTMTAKLTVIARGDFKAKRARIEFHRLWMGRFSENLPRIMDVGDYPKGRTYSVFRTRSGPSSVYAGIEMDPAAIIRYIPGQDYYQRSSGSLSLATMSLPVEDMASVGEATAGRELAMPRDATSVTPSPASTARLQRLHAAAARLAEEAPEIIANPNAANGLEQTLTEALVDCLASGEVRDDTVARRQHGLTMRRFRRFVEENQGEPLYITNICKAIGVSSRTLDLCCHEHLGMGPKRYLLLRRMGLARRALRQGAAGTASVTDIAMHYGFWQLGRFAVEYRSLSGESPSATLRRTPE